MSNAVMLYKSMRFLLLIHPINGKIQKIAENIFICFTPMLTNNKQRGKL